MKRIPYLALILLVLISLTACSQNSGNPEEELPNPMEEAASLDAINEMLGFTFDSLPESATDPSYFTISDTIAQADLTVDAITYTIRKAAKSDEDISGVYTEFEYSDTFPNNQGDSVNYQYFENGEGLATWSTADFDYSVYCSAGFELETMQTLVNIVS